MRTTLKATLAAALAAFFMSAHAAEPGNVIPGVKTVCDTEDQWSQIWEAHKGAGYDAALQVYRALSEDRNAYGEPVCGQTRTPLMVVRVIETTTLTWPQGEMWSQFVEFIAQSGRRGYGVIVMPKGGA